MTDWPDRPRWLKTTRPRAKLRAGRNDWYRFENLVTTDTTSIYIYDEVGYFGVSAADFVVELNAVTAPRIDLHLNSPGGEVFDGIAILEALRQHPAAVTTYVDSLAASVASVIAMAGERIVMGRNAQMMIHDASGFALNVGADDMRALADLLDKCSDNIASCYADRSGVPVEFWRTAMRAETWYSADEAVAAGLADEVAAPVGVEPVLDTFDLSVYAHAGRVNAPAPVIPDPLPAAPVVDLSELLCSAIREVVPCRSP